VTDFHRTQINDDNFIRGAARIMYADITGTFPSSIADIINLCNYDAMADVTNGHVWFDLGATKTGITVTVNNTEETFDVDQIYGDIDSRPTGWECTVSTALAEMTLKHFAFAWEGSTPGVVGSETIMGVGNPLVYTRRRLAVLFQKENGNIRAFVFRKAQRTPQESAVVYSKTGEQQTLPVRFRALADTSISDQLQRYFMIFDQDTTNQT
jgi:hypothetical protein